MRHNSTFTSWRPKGVIPSFRVGATVRFDPSALADWFKEKAWELVEAMGTRHNTARLVPEAKGFPNVSVRPGNSAEPDPPTPDLGMEKHYTVAELAKLWSLSEKTIRRMFENEPGVLQWGSEETRFKRAYTTLRIPESVMLCVHRRLRIAG